MKRHSSTQAAIAALILFGCLEAASANPYGVAGYISTTRLEQFGFPAGMNTYDWNNLRTDLLYQMVRPYHYIYRVYVPGGNYVTDWALYEAQTQPVEWFTQESYETDVPWNVRRAFNRMLSQFWSYYLDRTDGNHVGQVGLPREMLPQWFIDAGGDHQSRFEAWILANPGRIWLMGNEPEGAERLEDLGGQDALLDREYVVFYRAYSDFIGSRDPGARFSNAAMAMTTSPTWREQFAVENVVQTWNRILDMYASEYGEEMPVDIWNMHLYAGSVCEDPAVYRGKFVTVIQTFRDFVNDARGGIYRGVPMIMTEFNGTYDPPGSGATRENTVLFLRDFREDLNHLRIRGFLDEWFWFVSNGGTSFPSCSILESGSSLTIVGEEYRASAWTWEELEPPIYEIYGSAGVPFHSGNGGLWNPRIERSGGSPNLILADETNSGYAVVTFNPGAPAEWEVTLAEERHLAGLGTFSFLEGQGVGIQLRFEPDNALENELFIGYFHGVGGPDDGQSAVLLRAEGGIASNTTILDASSGATLRTGLDFGIGHRLYFIVNAASDVDFHLDSTAAPLATLARQALPDSDVNQLRFGSNSRDSFSGGRFRGTVDVFAYAADDDILNSTFTVERREPYLQLQ